VDGTVDLRQGTLLGPLAPDERPDLLVANLPYVPAAAWGELQREVRDHEPRGALVGGARGDELILALLAQACGVMAPRGAVFLEIHHDQGPSIGIAARELWPAARVAVQRDYAGLERIVEIELPTTQCGGIGRS
jgi:release factor glutamine methyltransferase